MDKEILLELFRDLKTKIAGGQWAKRNAQHRIVVQIDRLIEKYQTLEIRDEAILEGLMKKGEKVRKQLKKTPDKAVIEEIHSFLRYANAAVFDFKHDLRGVNYFVRSFLVMTMLFMALSPQFFGFMLPAVFLIPIYLGLRGAKQRSRAGLMMASSVAPVSILTGILWTRYGLYALSHFNEMVAQMVEQLNRSVQAAQLLIVVPSILGPILIIMALLTMYFGYKYREMFI